MSAQVDIVTGLPLEGIHESAAREDSARDRRDHRAASLCGISETQAAAALVSMVRDVLQSRFDVFCDQDPSARICCDILHRLGVTESQGRSAVRRLMERHHYAQQEGHR